VTTTHLVSVHHDRANTGFFFLSGEGVDGRSKRPVTAAAWQLLAGGAAAGDIVTFVFDNGPDLTLSVGSCLDQGA
jgi:hypothetical protein